MTYRVHRYAAHEDRVILFKDTGDKCRQCCKLQQELARTESEMVNILTEVQQARKTSKLMESLKVRISGCTVQNTVVCNAGF